MCHEDRDTNTRHGRAVPAPQELRKRVAREAVAILLGLPQTQAQAPSVRASDRPAPLQQQSEPLATRVQSAQRQSTHESQAIDVVGPGGHVNHKVGLADPAATSRLARPRKPSEKPENVGTGTSAQAQLRYAQRQRIRRSRRMSRPGGGRQPRPIVFTEEHALREVCEAFGQPTSRREGPVTVLQWTRGGGNGAVFARMSSRDVQQGETAAGQISDILASLQREQLAPRVIVLTLENSGYSEYTDRPDFDLTADWIQEGWLRWVAWRGVDRLARMVESAGPYFKLLRDNQIGLWLARRDAFVDWKADDITIQAELLAFRVEGTQIRERTHGRLLHGWLETGRGWPGCQRFGTRRDPQTKYLVEDPTGMEIVHFLYDQYVQLGAAAGSTSRRKLEKRVQDRFGVRLSPSKINQILRDPIYVTGEWFSYYQGMAYQGRPIQLSKPVALETYQRAQELLALRRGRNTATTPGEYCLNGLLIHAPCEHIRKGNSRSYVRLRGRYRAKNKTASYFHTPNTPEGCGRFGLPQAVIEPVVMRELRRLLREPELLEAWKNARRDPSPAADAQHAETAEPPAELLTRIRNLELQLEQLQAQTITAAEQGEMLNTYHYAHLRETLETRLNQLREQARQHRHQERKLQRPEARFLDERTQQALVQRASELLTDEVPEDDEAKLLRTALVHTFLSKIVVDQDADGNFKVQLHGWLVPQHHQAADNVQWKPEETQLQNRRGRQTIVDVLWTEAQHIESLNGMVNQVLDEQRAEADGARAETSDDEGESCAAGVQPDATGSPSGRLANAASRAGMSAYSAYSRGSRCARLTITPAELRAAMPQLAVRETRVLRDDLTVEVAVESTPVQGSPARFWKPPLSEWNQNCLLGCRRRYRRELGGESSWVSPTIRMSPDLMARARGGWNISHVRLALRLAARELPEDQVVLTGDFYRDFVARREWMPGRQALDPVCKEEGTSFRLEALAALMEVRGDPTRARASEWDDERVWKTLVRFYLEEAPDEPVGSRAWDQLARGRRDLPSRWRIAQAARARGGGFSDLQEEAFSEARGLSMLQRRGASG